MNTGLERKIEYECSRKVSVKEFYEFAGGRTDKLAFYYLIVNQLNIRLGGNSYAFGYFMFLNYVKFC